MLYVQSLAVKIPLQTPSEVKRAINDAMDTPILESVSKLMLIRTKYEQSLSRESF